MGHNVREVRIALEDTTVDQSRRDEGGLENQTDPKRQFELREVRGIFRKHRVFEDGQAQRIDARPQRFEARIVQRDAVDVRTDDQALHAEIPDRAFEFGEGCIDVVEGQAREAHVTIRMRAAQRGERIVDPARHVDLRRTAPVVDVRGAQRECAHVDAFAIHLADAKRNIEHVFARPGHGRPVMAVEDLAVVGRLRRELEQRCKLRRVCAVDDVSVNVDAAHHAFSAGGAFSEVPIYVRHWAQKLRTRLSSPRIPSSATSPRESKL